MEHRIRLSNGETISLFERNNSLDISILDSDQEIEAFICTLSTAGVSVAHNSTCGLDTLVIGLREVIGTVADYPPQKRPSEQKTDDEMDSRFCRVQSASVSLADGSGDGAYDLFDVYGTPEEVGREIAHSLSTCDISTGPTYSNIENGKSIFLQVTIEVKQGKSLSLSEKIQKFRDWLQGKLTDNGYEGTIGNDSPAQTTYTVLSEVSEQAEFLLTEESDV